MKTGYVPFDKALKTALAAAPVTKTERVALSASLHRVLAGDVVSDLDMPPFHCSAMDGFACRNADRDDALRVLETVAAGKMPHRIVTPGTCSRIMTGAPVPRGANMVAMFEDTVFDETTGLVSIVKKRDALNIRRRGEDVRAGSVVLRKGTIIGPAHIAILATVGKSTVTVMRRPRVGIIATGDELVEPSCRPRAGCIRNSNSYQLCAQVQTAGGAAAYYGIVGDDPVLLGQTLQKALRECDVLLISGGVSMGDFDFVPAVLKKKHSRILFEKIAVKPGHPTVFGVCGEKCLFGMPGNPVSTFVIFEMLVRPVLLKMTGTVDPRQKIGCILKSEIKRKKADRLEFRPVRIESDGKAVAVEYHGSAHIHSYSFADGIVRLPAGIDALPAGTVVEVTLLR